MAHLVGLFFIGAIALPVVLYVARQAGLLRQRAYEILQAIYCFALAGAFIAFGTVYVVETGGLFKPLDGEVTLANASFSEAPFSFLVTCALWLFICWVLVIGGWELLRRKQRDREKN